MAGVAAIAGEAAIGTGQAFLLLGVEESSDVAVGGLIGAISLVGDALCAEEGVAGVALALSILPGGIGPEAAAIAEVLIWDSVADALGAGDGVAGVADAQVGGSVPFSIGNEAAQTVAGEFALVSLEEVPLGAGAALVQVPELSSSAVDALVAIPAGVLGAHALQHVGIPGLSVLALGVGLAGVSTLVGAIWAGVSYNTSSVDQGGGGQALLGEGQAAVAVGVEAGGTVSIGDAGSGVPDGACGAGALEVDALGAIEVLPGHAVFGGTGPDTVSAIVVGVRRAGNLDATNSVPSLVGGAGGVST